MASSNVNIRLETARALLGHTFDPEATQPSWPDVLLELTGIDLFTCANCGSNNIKRYRSPTRWRPRWDTS